MEKTSILVLDGHQVPYTVVRSARARLLRLRVGPEPVVTIVVPAGRRVPTVERLLGEHRTWILSQLRQLREAASRAVSLVPGAQLPFLGSQLTLDLVPAPTRPAVRRVGDRLVTASADPPLLAGRLQAWYRDQAKRHFTERAKPLGEAMGVQYGKIAIRDQRSRWGSCSSRGNLNFSWRLMLAPAEVAEYVLIHELAHLLIPNHGADFWRLVERFCPDRRAHQRWLRENGLGLAEVLP